MASIKSDTDYEQLFQGTPKERRMLANLRFIKSSVKESAVRTLVFYVV